MPFIRNLGISVVFILIACSHESAFQARIFPHQYLGLNVLLRAAPVIVVGTVNKLELASHKAQAVVDGKTIELDRETTSIGVQTTLKGAVESGKEIVVERYSWTPAQGTDPNILKSLRPRYVNTGEQYIFFLEPLGGGRYRSIVDVTQSSVHLIKSESKRLQPTGRADRDIATVLLMEPPEDRIVGEFPESIRMAALNAASVAGNAWTLQSLRRLLESPSQAVRREACIVITENFWGQTSCLETIFSSNMTKDEQNRYRDLIAKSTFKSERIKQLFLSKPTEFLNEYGKVPFERCNELGVLASFEDAVVQERAKELLDEYFPEYRRSGCAPELNKQGQ